MALSVIFKLGEHIVPHLNIAVAVAAYGAARLAAAVLLSSVIVDLRAGTAGACPVLPEIILLAEAEDPLFRDAHLLIPDGKCLVILLINRRIQPVRRKPHNFGQKLPGPVDGLGLKIIPKRKIAQHLKKGAVAGSLSDILDIACADALLTGGDPLPRWDLLPGKIGL